MTGFRHFIGIDPGPTPGLVMLTPRGRTALDAHVVQCSAGVSTAVLWALLDQCRQSLGTAAALVEIERFVVGRGSGKSGRAGGVTRDLVGRLEREAEQQPNVTVVQRNASQAKAWATDARLEACGLYVQTKGMPHARDAARHALFAACHDGGWTDPLSKHHPNPGTEGAPA